jgi:hypothetical protein
MTTTRVRLWLALAVSLTFGCSDSTGPNGSVEVVLTPETVRRAFPDSAPLKVGIRNAGSTPVRLAFESAVVQQETIPGTWQRVAGGEGLYNITGTSIDIEPSAQLLAGGGVPTYVIPDIRYMPVGRYRVVIRYARLNSSRSEPATSGYVEAYSNVMVVTP